MSKNRYEINIKGIVQGIGFRPFIYKLAQDLNLKGWVKNSSEGVVINVECTAEELKIFHQKIQQEKPIQSDIYSLEIKSLNYLGYQEFMIKKSDSINNINKTAIMLPDLNICSECLEELFNPKNRRYRYPFLNCTNCGPRYSIIENLPYDRISTTMKNFVMCKECEEEYHNPLNRRFHAQPNACQKCGPYLELWDKNGNCLLKFAQALSKTVELIKEGNIIAIKGLGGFHLIVNANNQSAVKKLRLLKNRPDKPFALMYPNLEQIKQDCFVSKLEEKILLSSASPIVLLKRIPEKNHNFICEEVAPKNPYLGVMLPYTPLHHLLLAELNFPIIATSGNLKNEPICTDELEALTRLKGIADYFLIHNRPIFRPVDDSIVRVINSEIMILRRARGYALLPINLPDSERISENLRSPLTPLQKGGNQVKNLLQNGENQVKNSIQKGESQVKNPLQKGESQVKNPLQKGENQVKNPLQKGENQVKNPLQKGENQVKNPLQKGENQFKVPLFKGDLGGSNTSETTSKQENNKILALGGHLKNTIAISFNKYIFLSQHLGNLETPESLNIYEKTINNLSSIYDFQPDLIACDAHPDYYSTQYADKLSNSKNPPIPIIKVQHHLAHIFSTIVENNVQFPLLGIAWDGSGYGLDNTIWGGEFFYITNDKIQRIASFLPFPLLGGNKAILEPKRIALALLIQVFNNLDNIPKNLPIINSFSSQELSIFKTMLNKQLNSPLTSSVGRLFDGISALLNIRDKVSFEGQAAMELEFIINDLITTESYPFDWQYDVNSCSYLSWQPIIKNIIKDYLAGESLSLISAKFHLTLVQIIATIAKTIPVKNVVLSGGCFQNKYLLENTLNCLNKEKFNTYWSQKIPINDGGLALGQIAFTLKLKEIKTIKFN